MSGTAQLSLFPATADRPVTTYPNRPGFKSYGPSHEAAVHVAGNAARLRGEVLTELIRGGAGTADEIATRMRRSPLSIRPRLSELKALGKISATGERRLNESGMSAAVWRVL
jgi:hypothetical protein